MPGVELRGLREARPIEYLVRFAIGAAVSAGAGALGTTMGERFAGLFLAFPAILPASLTLLQENEGTRRAARDAVGAVLGAGALVAFACVEATALARLPAGLVLVAGLGAWAVVAVALYAVLAKVRPSACDSSLD